MPPENTAAENYTAGLGPDFVNLLTLENCLKIIITIFFNIDDVFNYDHGGGRKWNIGFKVLLAKYTPYHLMMDKVRWSQKPV